MRRSFCFLVGALLALLFAPAAVAQSNPPYARDGVYLAVAGLYALEDFDFAGADNGLGFTGRVGWRFSRWAAAELSGEYVPFDRRLPAGPGVFASEDFMTAAGMAQLKGILPLGRVEPYALFGIGGVVLAEDGGDSSSSFAWRGGLGVQLHVNEHLSAFLEGSYLGGTGGISDPAYGAFVWGLQWRF